jgi:hypothetical protein
VTRFVRNRKDGNHAEIVAALEAAGVRVVDLSDAGNGVPDIACWVRSQERWVFIEIKEKRGRMRSSQEKFRDRFPVVVARTVSEALTACGIEVAT